MIVFSIEVLLSENWKIGKGTNKGFITGDKTVSEPLDNS